MRDRDRQIQNHRGAYRIALIGDSLIEGAQVQVHEVVNIQMEEMLRLGGFDPAEVLNFGVAGIGTTQEYLLYTNRVRQFAPDVVVLVLEPANDIMNNSATLQTRAYGIRTWYAPYYALGSRGELVLTGVDHRTLDSVRALLERHFLLVHYAERAWSRVKLRAGEWRGIPLAWGVFGDPLDTEWKDAWDITERVLSLMRDTVEEDGSRFLIVVVPTAADIDPDWREHLLAGETPPAELNPNSAGDRLRRISERQELPMTFLAPRFKEYAKMHDLSWPYFSFRCDLHFSSLGHRQLSRAILLGLQQHGLLPPRSGAANSHGPSW